MTARETICRAFGEAVRTYRRQAELSQEELAARAGIHRTYIGGIERGERNPTLTMIYRLAEALQVQPGDLFRPLSAIATKRS